MMHQVYKQAEDKAQLEQLSPSVLGFVGATNSAKCFLNLFSMSQSYSMLETISFRGCNSEFLCKI